MRRILPQCRSFKNTGTASCTASAGVPARKNIRAAKLEEFLNTRKNQERSERIERQTESYKLLVGKNLNGKYEKGDDTADYECEEYINNRLRMLHVFMKIEKEPRDARHKAEGDKKDGSNDSLNYFTHGSVIRSAPFPRRGA